MKATLKLYSIGLILFSMASCATSPSGKDDAIGQMYLANHTFFAFKPAKPKGWILKLRPPNTPPTVFAALYPEGGSFKDSTSVMYIQYQHTSKEVKTLEGAPKYVIKGFKQDGHKNFKGKRIKTIVAQTGISVPIWEFTGDNFGNREISAYMMGDREILSVVLSSRSYESYQKSLPSFYELVRSYGGTLIQKKE